MTTLIFVFIGCALLHLIYEGVMLPMIRLELRNRLFILRDELRRLKIEQPNACSDLVFEYVDVGISRFINNLSWMTLSNLCRVMRHEPSAESKRRMNEIEACSSEKVNQIFQDASSVLRSAFISSFGVGFLYVIPIVVFGVCCSKIRTASKELITLPEHQADGVLSHA